MGRRCKRPKLELLHGQDYEEGKERVENYNTPACNQLNAFLNQVNAKQTNGQLTPQQAADLNQKQYNRPSDVVILVGC